MLVPAILVLFQAILVLGASSRAGSDPRNKYFVRGLPGMYLNLPADEVPIMYSGQLELFPENHTHYYFWRFSDSEPIPEARKRTIFWLNGGPGCSSMDGALMEAGPFRINDNHEIVYNEGSWHKAAKMVFVDQPAGTGFSFSDGYEHELPDVTVHFVRFMEKYFELFPEDIDNELFLAGESYAGQYIPYIADGILRRNKNLQKDDKPFNLSALLIGNGWVAPNEQSMSYVEFALQAGIVSPTTPGWSDVLVQQEKCQNVVNDASAQGDTMSDYRVVSDVCDKVLNTLLRVTRDDDAPRDQQCVNMYDYTLRDVYPSCGMNWPPDLVNVGPFLNNPGVQMQLNLEHKSTWHECSGKVGRNFWARTSRPAVHLLPGILEEIPILLFNGNRDIICNYIGTEAYIDNMKWNGHEGWDDKTVFNWQFDGSTAGYVRNSRNLTFVNVFNSSHMVPFDVPFVSRSLIDLATGNYDIKESEVITYKLGTRAENKSDEPTRPEKPAQSENAEHDKPESTTQKPDLNAQTAPSATGSLSSASAAALPESQDKAKTSHKIERAIQFLVILVLLWGIYALYSSYRSRPSLIIKSGPNGKKKNVQWADQLRRFQEEDNVRVQPHGIFAKALNKLKGGGDPGYAPVGTAHDDIEMRSGSRVDDFVVVSDEEEAAERH